MAFEGLCEAEDGGYNILLYAGAILCGMACMVGCVMAMGGGFSSPRRTVANRLNNAWLVTVFSTMNTPKIVLYFLWEFRVNLFLRFSDDSRLLCQHIRGGNNQGRVGAPSCVLPIKNKSCIGYCTVALLWLSHESSPTFLRRWTATAYGLLLGLAHGQKL